MGSQCSLWGSKDFDAACGCSSCEFQPEFAMSVPHQVSWSFSIRSRLSQLLCHPGIRRRSGHIHMKDLTRLPFDEEEGEKWTQEEVRYRQEIASPYVFCMMAQKGLAGLATRALWTDLLHLLLIVRFLAWISSLRSSPRIRSAPHSRLVAAICLIKLIVSGESLGLHECLFDLRFQNQRKSSRGPRRRVCGWTRKSACFQARTMLARSTRSTRSVFRETGRLICRRRMISWCRTSAFSPKSSALPHVRSVSVPRKREGGGGLIHCKKHT
jgi:hypothetical protein